VAIGALRGLWRIVERPSALAGNAAGLPIVVFVEAANPTIVVHRYIEVNFVAGGAEFRRLIAHEGLKEYPAMRLRIQVDEKIVQAADDRILAGSQLMQLGILQIKVRLAHGAFHFGDGVAHHAAQAGLRFGSMHKLLDGTIHFACVKDCRIMAAAAPL
jgi:hypothetical protein